MTLTQDLLKPTADALPSLCTLFGAILLALAAPPLVAPAKLAPLWRAYPRSAWPGRILTIIALVWAGLWLMVMPLGPVVFLRKYMLLLVPVSIAAVWYFCDELLSCRAIGGILVFLPTLLLNAAQWHPSPLRYIPIFEAYIGTIAGMYFIAKPYLLRDLITFVTTSPTRFRTAASILAALGLALLATALA